jgi:hypothetical protein
MCIWVKTRPIAASQAGCLYISPYFNEVKAHDDPKLWPDVEDPATQHTMSARTMQILQTYARLYKETGKDLPLLKHARYAHLLSRAEMHLQRRIALSDRREVNEL